MGDTPKNLTYDKSWKGWRLQSDSFKKNIKLINYLKIYSLKTKKSIAFKKWYSIHKLILRKEHLTKLGLNKIKILTQDIN